MDKTISITEILGAFHNGTEEICASASAEYDPAAETVSVSLRAFTRSPSLHGNRDDQRSEPWLPRDERVTEHLPRGDANAFTRDVFESWAQKIRASIPKSLRSTS